MNHRVLSRRLGYGDNPQKSPIHSHLPPVECVCKLFHTVVICGDGL